MNNVRPHIPELRLAHLESGAGGVWSCTIKKCAWADAEVCIACAKRCYLNFLSAANGGATPLEQEILLADEFTTHLLDVCNTLL